MGPLIVLKHGFEALAQRARKAAQIFEETLASLQIVFHSSAVDVHNNAGFHRRCFGAGHKMRSTRGSSQLLRRPCARIATQTPTAAACFLEPQLMLETGAMSSIRRVLGMFSVSELRRVPPGLDPDAALGRNILSCARADEGGRRRVHGCLAAWPDWPIRLDVRDYDNLRFPQVDNNSINIRR